MTDDEMTNACSPPQRDRGPSQTRMTRLYNATPSTRVEGVRICQTDNQIPQVLMRPASFLHVQLTS